MLFLTKSAQNKPFSHVTLLRREQGCFILNLEGVLDMELIALIPWIGIIVFISILMLIYYLIKRNR